MTKTAAVNPSFIIKSSAELPKSTVYNPASGKFSQTTAPAETSQKFSDILGVLVRSLKEPKEAGLNVVSWLTLPIPILAGFPLMAGLIARWLSDEQLKKGEIPNNTIRFLRDSYPVFYTAMLGCGLANGLSYASPCRMLSYGALLYWVTSPGGLWQNENTRSQSWEKLIALQKEQKNSKNKDSSSTDEQIGQTKQQLADANAGISIFSRVWYCAGMFLTFLANVTQQAPQAENLSCKVPKAFNWKDFSKELGEYFGFNSGQEFKAGGTYLKRLFSFNGLKTFWNVMNGGDKNLEALLDTKGLHRNSWKRIPQRMGHPEVNSMFTMANGVLRLITVLTTVTMATLYLGGKSIFNEGTNGEDKKTASLIEKYPWAKKIFDVAMFLNNIGMLLMGISSFATSFNLTYIKEKAGPVAGKFQFLTGAFYTAAAACDQAGLFVLSILLKIGGNICAMLANIMATAFRAGKFQTV